MGHKAVIACMWLLSSNDQLATCESSKMRR